MCFDNYIGLEGCGTNAPTSGFSLNDIGITKDNLDAIVQRDYDSGTALGQGQIDFAIKSVTNQILASFGDKIQAKTLVNSSRLGKVQENIQVQDMTANYHGVEVEICNSRSYLDMAIAQFSLHTNYTGNVEIKVFDLHQGREIDSFTVASVAGEIVTVNIDKVYTSYKKDLHLFIGYDATLVDSVKYTVFGSTCVSCAKSCSPVNSYLSARGGTLGLVDTPIESNMVGSAFTGGIAFNYSISCNMEGWMCDVKNVMALPILYKAGSLISQYALRTSRSNSDTMIDVDKWEAMVESLEFNYRESMDNVIHNMRLPQDPRCFECHRPIKRAIVLP